MIETIKLYKSFGTIQAVDDLSFKVEKGEVLGFLGPNGAGKSTTMKILTCFMAPTSGTATVCGHDILDDPMAVRRVVGYLPESAPAYAEMSVLAFLNFVGAIRGFSGAGLSRAVENVIDMCVLDEVRHQMFDTLSKGFKRRVCLAQALIHDPEVLIMDEPTDGLDPNQKHEVRQLISRMAENKVIVLSTHILEEVDAVCTRAVIIARGRLVADGTPESLKQRSRYHGAIRLSVKGVEKGAVREALERLENVKSVEDQNGAAARACCFMLFPNPGKAIASQVSRLIHEKSWDVEEMHVEQGHLDEVFRELTLGAEESKGS